MISWIEKVFELKKQKENFVIVTMVAIEGSAPQDVGAKMLVNSNGLLFGTIGGGKIENHCINVARELLVKKSNFESYKWNLQKDIGMTCGGAVTIAFEAIREESLYKVAVFGAGHVSQELIPLLLKANFQVTVADSRIDWISKFRPESNLKIIQSDNLDDLVDELDESTFIVSMTMGHAHDLPILVKALKRSFPFVGVIGSEQKRNVLEKELLAKNVSQRQVDQMHCPIGEQIGGNDPFEIAISVVAQLINLRKR